MEQIKPTDLKEVAKRYAAKYFPQWLSRVDRIWDMLEKADPAQILSGAGELDYRQGALGIDGRKDPQFNEYISGIAILAFTYRDIQGQDDVGADEIKKRITITPAGMKISGGLQKKLEEVLAEMLPSMVKGTVKREAAKNEAKEFVVYLSRPSGFGADRFLADEEELHSKYLIDKELYDIIVYQQNVEVKSIVQKGKVKKAELKPIEIHANILNLLILFLKHKNENLPFLDLYHCAWEGSAEYKRSVTGADEIMDNLKAGVSALRRCMEDIENFRIPNAKRGSGTYTCKGEFDFCLVLRDSDDQRYTLGAG